MMLRHLSSSVLAASVLASPAQAIVGGTRVGPDDPIGRFTVQIESSRGQLCSGVVIDERTVLSAAHCVLGRGNYRVTVRDERGRRVTVPVRTRVVHPSFRADRSPMTQPGIDLAVLRLTVSLPGSTKPARLGGWGAPGVGEGLVIAGFGLGEEGKPATARILRRARLISTGAFASANSVLVAVDAKGMGLKAGAGACRGDSGGPIVSEGADNTVVGLVSWSSAPSASAGQRVCGGFTALTPLFSHRGWIAETAAALAR